MPLVTSPSRVKLRHPSPTRRVQQIILMSSESLFSILARKFKLARNTRTVIQAQTHSNSREAQVISEVESSLVDSIAGLGHRYATGRVGEVCFWFFCCLCCLPCRFRGDPRCAMFPRVLQHSFNQQLGQQTIAILFGNWQAIVDFRLFCSGTRTLCSRQRTWCTSSSHVLF